MRAAALGAVLAESCATPLRRGTCWLAVDHLDPDAPKGVVGPCSFLLWRLEPGR